ncbi:MAG: folate-binding protein [Alphaproteobacteria bacterium]|nr:folate-binding protein [Alphaproteobacteria bacterium]
MTRPGRVERSLIAVTGPDARDFLQNLLTQDLDKLDASGVVYAALLSPQGKVSADMFVWAREEGLLLDVDPSRGADLMRRFSMYKLRANVTLADVSGEVGVLVSTALFGGAVSDPRLAALGFRAIAPKSDAVLASTDENRIAAGVPDLTRDAQPEEVFAGEALLEELNGVAFDKGCFVGQENVSRMKRRATTRKKFCPVVFDGEPMVFGTPLLAGEAEIGSVRTGVAGRAISLLRLDRALDAVAAGKPLTAAGREIRLDPPPWLILPQREDDV